MRTLTAFVIGLCVLAVSRTAPTFEDVGVCPRIVSRDDWGARPPKAAVEMHSPVSTVVIHHTYSPAYCNDSAACMRAMKSMQNYHMDDRGWDDIGYSFAVGGDGRVYKGRGWNRVGAHSPPYNSDSIGITLIGDWTREAPPTKMLEATKWLIGCGVKNGRISEDYQLIGHRQARSTECPGEALFGVIKTWDRWTASPAPPRPRSLVQTAAVEPATDVAPAPVPVLLDPMTPVAVAGTYDPANPTVERDAVEVRQLNKRSLWDRLVHIWQQEALRQSRQAASEAASEAAENS